MNDEVAVLHVDDEPAFSDLVRQFLERRADNLSVTSASSVDDAVEALERGRYDCVVSDYDMPTMNGLEFLEHVRAEQPALPFILFTGKGSEEIASEAISAGVTDYVQKGGADQYTVLINRIENAARQYRDHRELAIKTRAMDNAPIGIAMSKLIDGEPVVTDVNASVESVTGKSASDLVGEPCWFLDEESYDPTVVEAIREAIAEAETTTVELLTDREGEPTAWNRTTVAPVTNSDREAPGSVDRFISFHEDVTDQKDREQRLERHRDLLERTQRIANVGGWELDFEADDLRWTDEVRRIHGVDQGFEPTLEDAVSFYHPDDRATIEGAVARAIDDDGGFDLELRIVRPSGAVRWVRTRGEPHTDDGQVVTLRGTIQDVTERVEQESQLRSRSAAIETSMDGIAILDATQEFAYVNQSFADLFGYDDPADVHGTPWQTLVDPDERARLENEAVPAVQAEGHWRGETVGVRADGRPCPLEVSLTAVETGGGVAVVRDISERKRRMKVVESLHRVATQLQSERTVEAVAERTVSAAADLLEFDICTVILREDEWLVPYAVSDGSPADGVRRMRIDEGLAGKTYQSGEPAIVERVAEDDDADPASESYQSGISVPIGEYGVFQATETTSGAFDDADVELAELLLTHAATAIERIEREAELEQQNDRFQEFSSVVSHDIRNPLNVANGHLELVAEREGLDGDDDLQEVRDALDRIDALIDDLLTLARHGRDIDDRDPVALAALVNRCWDYVETGSATLELAPELEGTVVLADRSRLIQLFENLFRNAIEHGSQRIDGEQNPLTVTVGPLETGFYVADDGSGIDPSTRDRIFSSGFTTSDTGTGMGLSIVARIVEAHDWHLELGEPDVGTRFEITGVDTPGGDATG